MSIRHYFMVQRYGGQTKDTQYESYVEATNEANRLAATHPGAIFVVLQAVAAWQVIQPAPQQVTLTS